MNILELKHSPPSPREVRDSIGLNQVQFANLMNVSQDTVSRWDSGEVDINSLNYKNVLILHAILRADESGTVYIDLAKTKPGLAALAGVIALVRMEYGDHPQLHSYRMRIETQYLAELESSALLAKTIMDQ